MKQKSKGSTRVSKRRNKWVMVYTIPDSTKPRGWAEHIETCDSEESAWSAKFAMQKRIDAGEFAAKPLTFGEAAWHWLDTRDYKPVTRKQYGKLLTSDKGLADYLDKPLKDVALMRRELSELGNTMGIARRAMVKYMMPSVVNLAVAEGSYTGANRLVDMEMRKHHQNPRKRIPHTAEQLNTIVASMPEHTRLVTLLMRGCGLRIGEAMAMETDALHDSYLEVKRGVTKGFDGFPKKRRKGFVPREVPIPHWLAPLIAEHVDKYAVNGVLFPAWQKNNESKYRSADGWANGLRKAVAKAGLPTGNADTRLNFSSHQFRKNWATQLRDESGALEIDTWDIEQWIGHKNLTRDSYAEQSRAAMDRGRNLSDPRSDS